MRSLNAGESQKFEKPLRLSEMEMMVDPVSEWKQIFNDAWRLERDYFYDASMHGVDWNLMKERYSKMLEGAMTREEVDFVIGEMIGELNSSHTYHGGGDLQEETKVNVGYLGVNWHADGKYYKIKKIIRGASWDAEARSSLDQPGVDDKRRRLYSGSKWGAGHNGAGTICLFSGPGQKNSRTYLQFKSLPLTGSKTAIVQTLDNEYVCVTWPGWKANRKQSG